MLVSHDCSIQIKARNGC